jgi:hypothetical protein
MRDPRAARKTIARGELRKSRRAGGNVRRGARGGLEFADGGERSRSKGLKLAAPGGMVPVAFFCGPFTFPVRVSC